MPWVTTDNTSSTTCSESPSSRALAELSAEILALERVHHNEGLSLAQSKHWTALIREWIQANRKPNERRRFLRLPCRLEVQLVLASGSRPFDTIEISHNGLSLAGDVGRGLQAGVEVCWRAARTPGGWVEIGAACQIVHTPNPSTVGLVLTETSGQVRERLFERVYYPAYLSTLEAMASGEMASL